MIFDTGVQNVRITTIFARKNHNYIIFVRRVNSRNVESQGKREKVRDIEKFEILSFFMFTN